MSDTKVTERDAIVIRHPEYKYELQVLQGVDETETWEYYDAANYIDTFLSMDIRYKKSRINVFDYTWRIVRASDKVIVACKYVAQVQA